MDMVKFWQKKASTSHQDSFDAAFFDWIVIGIQAGFRKSEWVQDSHDFRSTGQFALNRDGSSKAFIASDFSFTSLSPAQKIKYPVSSTPYSQVTLTWRFQKNNQNNQRISFNHNFTNELFSPVLAAQRILDRARRLQVPTSHPISVFFQDKKIQYMHHSLIESTLRTAASAVYKLTSQKALRLFSCHSIRVGACVILHAAQKDPLFIQFRLRWRSTSFIVYLRNTPRIAAIHNDLINTINTDDLTVTT